MWFWQKYDDTYASHMLLIGEVKIVHFILERVQNLAMPGHVRGQNQCDDSLPIHCHIIKTCLQIVRTLLQKQNKTKLGAIHTE